MDGLKTWVINLDRAPERLTRIDAQLRRLGLPYQRLAAVDARSLTPAQHRLLDDAAYRRRHGKTPALGELGCYLSHVQALQLFLASDAPAALILEDDVLLHDSLPEVLRGLLAHPAQWDMVKLSGVHAGTPVRGIEIAQGHRLAVMLTRCTGSSAYAVNRRAAAAYLQGPCPLLPMQLPYDHVFDQGWRFGIRVRLVTPTPCGHDEHITTTIAAAAKFHWTRRWSAYRYRIATSLRRLGHGLVSALGMKLRGR